MAEEILRHTTAQMETITPVLGSIQIDTDKDTVVVGDGSTKGGIPSATGPELAAEVAALEAVADLTRRGIIDSVLAPTLWFNGVSDDVVRADDANLDFLATDDFSIVMLVKPSDVTRTTDYLINKETGGVGWGLYVNADDLYIRIDDGVADSSAIIGAAVLADAEWASIAVAFDRSGNATAYVNGVLVGTVDISDTDATLANAGALHIGNDSADGNEFYGEMGSVRVYNTLLSASECITLTYSGGKLPVPYKYDGGSQTNHIDEPDFASHANWDVTGDLDDSGGNATYTWASNTTSTLTQVNASLAVALVGLQPCMLRYTVAVTTAPDGDLDMTLTTGIATAAVVLPFTAGTHEVFFMTKGTPGDFVISIIDGTGTEGTFSIDDIVLVNLGCVLNYDSKNFSPTIVYDSSGNDLDGTVSGAALLNEVDTAYAAKQFIAGEAFRGLTSLYRRYYHVPVGSTDPGASGATFIPPDGNSVGGWGLDAAGELLYFGSDIHGDWDGVTDITVEVKFICNVDNSGGAAPDTVDLKLVAYYAGVGDVATKTQTVEVATVIGACAQYTMFKAEFTIDHDLVSHVVEVGDDISFILNLETDTSEVDDITIATGGTSISYQTTHVGIEAADV